MEQQETALLMTTVVPIALVIFTITLFMVLYHRKNNLLLQQQETDKKYERAITETQIEIREETLRNISWELHDNIGQLLTLAKIQIDVAKDNPEKISEVTETISKSLTELRSLSKLIKPDAIKNLSLTKALCLEVDRFNRLQFIETSLNYNTEIRELNDNVEIIIFRILQEFFSNTVKHSQASKLDVDIHYSIDKLVITAKDNGIGFDINGYFPRKGIGIFNMQNRAKLIGADISINSKKEEGTTIEVSYNYKNEKYPKRN